jgi:hypothetical protein
MVENARFFAQKRTFLHIFAGGRGDFLAGPKSGFWGVRVSRERPRPRPVFRSGKTPDGQRKQKKNFFFHLHYLVLDQIFL